MATRRKRGKGSRVDLTIAKGRDCSTADTLKASAVSYFLKGGYSCFLELGVNSWGNLRADMLGVNLRRRIVICEIKSSVRDYQTDKKFMRYLDYCNRMYFVFTRPVFDKLLPRLKEDFKGTGIGVLVLNPNTGYLDVKKKAKDREIEDDTTMNLITRMAWRGGISKRTNRRTRHYISDGTQYESVEDQKDCEEEQPKEKRTRRR